MSRGEVGAAHDGVGAWIMVEKKDREGCWTGCC